MDYEFEGVPSSTARHVWVIQSRSNEVAIPVRLKRSGTLQTFVPGWQPTDAPFSCYLAEMTRDGKQRQISDVEGLR